MLRAGIIAGLDEADFWSVYDDIHNDTDPTVRPLRDEGEPFFDVDKIGEPLAAAADELSGTVDVHLNQPQLPRTWFRGFGYYNTYHNNRYPGRRWGDYSLVQNVKVEAPPDPSDAAAYAAYMRENYQAAQQKTLLAKLGFYAAWDLAPASTIWFFENTPYAADWPFRIGFETDYPRALVNDDETQNGPGDRLDVGWLASYWMTTGTYLDAAGLAEPYEHRFRHAWHVPQIVDGEARGGLYALTEDAAEGAEDFEEWRADSGKWSAAVMLAYGRDRNPVIAASEVPEHWPHIDLQRMSWTLQGPFRNWVRVTATDPLTARQLSVSMEGQGSTLRGARMLRKIASEDKADGTTP